MNIVSSFDHQAKQDGDPSHQMIAKDLTLPYQYPQSSLQMSTERGGDIKHMLK